MGRWSLLAVALGASVGCGGSGRCSPETDEAFCQRHGKDCGSYTDFDDCGGSRTVACGTCALTEVCGGGGVVNVCGPTTDGGPAMPEIVFRGTITTNPEQVLGVPNTDAFDALEGVPIECRSSIPTLDRTTIDSVDYLETTYEGFGPSVVCSGSTAPELRNLQDVLDDVSTRVRFRIETDLDQSSTVRAEITSPDAAEMFRVTATCSPSPEFSVDADGFAVLAPYVCDPTTIYWARIRDTSYLTDVASGEGVVESDAM